MSAAAHRDAAVIFGHMTQDLYDRARNDGKTDAEAIAWTKAALLELARRPVRPKKERSR